MPELTPERLEEIRSFLRWEEDWYHHQLLSHIDSLQAKVDAVRNDECMGWVLYHEESRNIRYRVLDNLNRSHEPDEEDDS